MVHILVFVAGLVAGVVVTALCVVSGRDVELTYYRKQCKALQDCNDSLAETLRRLFQEENDDGK